MSFLKQISQPKVFMMKWGIHGRRLRVFILGLCSLMALYIVYNVFYELDEAKRKMEKHTAFYCNKPGFVQGKEGQLPFIKKRFRNYELVQVQMVVRHGDRAPIALDTLPNTRPVEISCIFNNTWKDYHKLDKIKQAASMFKILGNPKRKIIQERKACIGGQLTPIGFLQHIANGEHFRTVYPGLLKTIHDPMEVLVMATDYSRTVQSSAALLYGMFAERFSKQHLTINVQHDKYPETHFLKDEKGDAISCPILIRRLRDIWQRKNLVNLRQLINPVKREFAKLYDTERSHIPSLDMLIDVMYTRICHGQGLPPAPNGKISYELASKSFDLSHKLISLKHTPLSELQTLSMLSQMVQHATGLIDGGSDVKKLVIFSGHDTVVVPFLAMLGAHDGKWPPYASRVVLELWHGDQETQINQDSRLYAKFNGYFIRVVYNGKILTRNVKFCIGKIVDGELCPLREFVKYVSNNEFDGSNFFNRIKNICAVS